MIDLHCHILHGVDDGPQSIEESLTMARTAVNDGIHSVVATPHTLNGIYLNRAKEVISKVANLQNALSENHIELKVYAGLLYICVPGCWNGLKVGMPAQLVIGENIFCWNFPHK